jgi:hypothetical protein
MMLINQETWQRVLLLNKELTVQVSDTTMPLKDIMLAK